MDINTFKEKVRGKEKETHKYNYGEGG